MDKAICWYLVEAYRKLDREEFNFRALAQSHGCATESVWADKIELEATHLKLRCINGFENPEACLKNPSFGMFWAEAEVIFNQSMNQARYSPDSVPVRIGADLLHEFKNHAVLIADLLPELVELNQFDLQMQAVLRRRWASIDLVINGWYRDERKDRSAVPHW